MKPAVALRSLLTRIASALGLEGGFLLVGTALLAVFASYLHPAGALAVVGVMCIVIGIALAVPVRRTE